VNPDLDEQRPHPSKAADRLPPLDLLAAFEAVARHLSFTNAAAERFITQSAMSRQIRNLEERLGTTLFERKARGLALTDDGRRLQIACAEMLAAVRATIGDIRTKPKRPLVAITTTPGFALMWLVPNLQGFTRQHPDVNVRIDSNLLLQDLKSGPFDLAVRYGRADAPLGSLLFAETVIPVCSPELASDRKRPLKRTRDLEAHTLLQVDVPLRSSVALEWECWFAASGIKALRPAASLSFSNYDQAIRAGVSGQGVALGRIQLIEDLLRQGQLIAPFGQPVVSPRAHYVSIRKESAAKPEVIHFERWLREQVQKQSERLAADGGLPRCGAIAKPPLGRRCQRVRRRRQ
jgi:LysR family glycine cleavage system transcriptional activator